MWLRLVGHTSARDIRRNREGGFLDTKTYWAFPDAALRAGDTAVSETGCPCPPGDYSLAE